MHHPYMSQQRAGMPKIPHQNQSVDYNQLSRFRYPSQDREVHRAVQKKRIWIPSGNINANKNLKTRSIGSKYFF